MKKLLVITLIFGFYSVTQAQFIKNVGIKIGGTASTQKWEYNPFIEMAGLKPDTKIGLNVGAFAEFLNLPFISLIGEVNYVEKGMQIDVLITDINNPEGRSKELWKTGINYLNFSLLAKVRLEGIIFTPYLLAGPKFDIELGKSGKLVSAGSMFDDFTKTRFGFKAGIGTEIKLFNITFLTEVLYDADFGTLYESGILKVTSSAVDFRTGVSIGF